MPFDIYTLYHGNLVGSHTTNRNYVRQVGYLPTLCHIKCSAFFFLQNIIGEKYQALNSRLFIGRPRWKLLFDEIAKCNRGYVLFLRKFDMWPMIKLKYSQVITWSFKDELVMVYKLQGHLNTQLSLSKKKLVRDHLMYL